MIRHLLVAAVLALAPACATPADYGPVSPEARIRQAAATARELIGLVESPQARERLVAVLTALERAAGAGLESDRLNWLQAALIVSAPLVAEDSPLDADDRRVAAAVRAAVTALLPPSFFEDGQEQPSD